MSLLFDGVGAPALLLISVFLAVTAVLWLLLPFSIFGIKTKLDEQLKVLRSIDRNLERLQRTRPKRAGGAAMPPTPAGPNTAVEPAAAPSDVPEKESPKETAVNPSPPHRGDDRWQKPPQV